MSVVIRFLHVAAEIIAHKTALHDPSDKDNHQSKPHYDYRLNRFNTDEGVSLLAKVFNFHICLILQFVIVIDTFLQQTYVIT